MGFFQFNFKKISLIFAVVISLLVFINMKRSLTERPWFLRPFIFFMGVIQDNYSLISGTIRSTTSLYTNLVGIKKENTVLRREHAKIQSHLSTLNELRRENDRLKKLLGFKQRVPMKLLTARVIGKDLISGRDTIIINRGSVHGVKKLMAAITIEGVVGFVRQVHYHTAVILLITDIEFVADSLVQRSRVRGLTEGLGRNICRLYYLQRGDDIVKGDLVITSGLNNIFPKGLPIGTITSIVQENKNSIRRDIEIKPAINPQKLEEIFIVLNVNKEKSLNSEMKSKKNVFF